MAAEARRMRGFTLALAPALALCAGGLVAAPALAQEIGMSPLSALQQSLHLNAQQEAAWKVYRQQAGAPQQAQGRRQAAAKMLPKLTAPQRMDLIEAEMRQEMVDLQKQSQALKT